MLINIKTNKKMQKKSPKKTCILLLFSYEIPASVKFLDNYNNFKLLLSEGVSSFLIKPKTPSLLSSILGFSKTPDKNLENPDLSLKPCQLTRFDNIECEEKRQIIEEDTMTEIRYISSPKTFAQVSSRLNAVVLTNSRKTAEFCQNISLDYYFDEEMEAISKNSEFLSKMLSEEQYELVILDIIFDEKPEKTRFQQFLQVFDREIIDLDRENLSYYLLVSPYLQGENIGKVLNSHKSSKDPVVTGIIPKQTYEYLNGSINEDFIEISKNFKDFELGKLPKFGA